MDFKVVTKDFKGKDISTKRDKSKGWLELYNLILKEDNILDLNLVYKVRVIEKPNGEFISPVAILK